MKLKSTFIFTLLLSNFVFIPLVNAGWQRNLAKLRKPIVKLFAPLVIGKGAYEMNKSKARTFCNKNGNIYICEK